jgi:hypothetical protein
MNDPIKLAKMMFALGELCKSSNGIIGRLALDSTHRQLGRQTATMAKEAIMRGWDHGKMFPPRF